jgi:UDP-N-acetyl-D-glucosamine/UDP-N-acetyl-D-galactosamine dehydrogenase
MIEDFRNRNKSIAVIGLGYVGLPIAIEFAKIFKVIGFDIKKSRIEQLRKGIDSTRETEPSVFKNLDIDFTSEIESVKDAVFFIIAVPTPIDEFKKPDLSLLLSATKTVASILKKGDIVVYESTVYPGCTEEDCVPILEQISGLEYLSDFKVGYSPERINPGDKEHTLSKITKVVSACDEESLQLISEVYSSVIDAGIYKASSIKVAEAAKIIENTQRDVNIGLMNELSKIFDKMNINTYEVLEAANTKWNFLNFAPGLVGGHCIGVDPYYLSYKASQLGYHAQIINSGRYVNDSMGNYIAKQAIKKLIALGVEIRSAKALIMGITFKENVSDIRNSKVVDIYNELKSYGLENIEVVDPLADEKEVLKEYNIELKDKIGFDYDLIIMAVNHNHYKDLDENYFKKISKAKCVFFDIKGIFKNKIRNLSYWSL